MTGTIIYLMLSSIDKREPHGKRGRKAIMQRVKKALVTEGNKDRERYLKIVEDADSIIQAARGDMDNENFLINPGTIVSMLYSRYGEYIEPFSILPDHIDNLKKAYDHSKAGFRSVQITNRIVARIDKYIEEKDAG
jgi:hypothetical protein